MIRRLALFVAALCALFSVVVADVRADDKPPTSPKNVILLSWDGLDRSVLKELLEKQKLPNLAALIKEGSLQEIEVKGHATVTKPGHAEMLTGMDAQTTGVYTNQNYQPIPEGYTIFERLQKHLGGKENVRTFMVTGKIAHVGGRGPAEGAGTKPGKPKNAQKKAQRAARAPEGADDSPKVETKGEPFYVTKRSLDVFDAAQRDAAETGPLCLKYLDEFKSPRFLAFLHFSDPDHAGHAHGSNSEEYRQAAVTCDEWLGKIGEWLRKEKLYDQTLIYVTTDHGFDPNARTHNKAPHAWLVTNDKGVKRGGVIADIPATILSRFGVDLTKLEPKLIGTPLVVAPQGAP